MASLSCEIPVSFLADVERRARDRGCDVSSVISAALASYLETPLHTLFQISTSGSLVEGVYAQAVTCGKVLEHGDFGLGTFADLDGEMVVTPDEIAPVLRRAMECEGPVIVGVNVDYCDNASLFEKVDQSSIH